MNVFEGQLLSLTKTLQYHDVAYVCICFERGRNELFKYSEAICFCIFEYFNNFS